MRQTYFGVDSVVYHELENDLKRFSQLTRDMFNHAMDKEQKMAVKKEKEGLKELVQGKLSESGNILGFLTLEQVKGVEKTIQAIDKEEMKGLLRSNFIPYHRLEELIVSLTILDAIDPLKNLIFFLERAKQNQQNIIVWIM